MHTTIYKAAWAVYAAVIALLAVCGWLGDASFVVLGMTAFGLIYFGMMLVLPLSIKHPNEATSWNDRVSQFRSSIERVWLAFNPADSSMRSEKPNRHLPAGSRRMLT